MCVCVRAVARVCVCVNLSLSLSLSLFLSLLSLTLLPCKNKPRSARSFRNLLFASAASCLMNGGEGVEQLKMQRTEIHHTQTHKHTHTHTHQFMVQSNIQVICIISFICSHNIFTPCAHRPKFRINSIYYEEHIHLLTHSFIQSFAHIFTQQSSSSKVSR